MIRLLVVFLGFLFGSGGAVQRPTGPGAGILFLALGDSYTLGEGVAAKARWPVQLAALARAQGVSLQAPDLIARTGWTTAELQAAISAAPNAPEYGLVSLLSGANNQYRGQTMAQYRVEFRALLGTAVHFAGGQPRRVVVLSTPDWGSRRLRRGRAATRLTRGPKLTSSTPRLRKSAGRRALPSSTSRP